MKGVKRLTVFRNSFGFIEGTGESAPGYNGHFSYLGLSNTEDPIHAKIFYHTLRDAIKDGYEIEIIGGDCMDIKNKNREVVKHGVDGRTRKIIENAVENKGFPRELYEE